MNWFIRGFSHCRLVAYRALGTQERQGALLIILSLIGLGVCYIHLKNQSIYWQQHSDDAQKQHMHLNTTLVNMSDIPSSTAECVLPTLLQRVYAHRTAALFFSQLSFDEGQGMQLQIHSDDLSAFTTFLHQLGCSKDSSSAQQDHRVYRRSAYVRQVSLQWDKAKPTQSLQCHD